MKLAVFALLMMLGACSKNVITNEGAHIALVPLADAHAASLQKYDLPDEVLVTGARLICGVDAVGGDPC